MINGHINNDLVYKRQKSDQNIKSSHLTVRGQNSSPDMTDVVSWTVQIIFSLRV